MDSAGCLIHVTMICNSNKEKKNHAFEKMWKGHMREEREGRNDVSTAHIYEIFKNEKKCWPDGSVSKGA